jgi:hypothetical protein
MTTEDLQGALWAVREWVAGAILAIVGWAWSVEKRIRSKTSHEERIRVLEVREAEAAAQRAATAAHLKSIEHRTGRIESGVDDLRNHLLGARRD